MASAAVLQAKGLEKSFQGLRILYGLDLTILEGEFVAILGKSGAGKSTLLHILGTLDRPDAGQLLFRDRDLLRLRGRALNTFRNRQLGFVFQFHHLLPEFTALENVSMPGRIAGLSAAEAESRALKWLERAGLRDRAHHYPAQLSGGEQQRVAMVRALMNDPAIILADEPTGNLDPNTALHVLELFRLVRQERPRVAIVMVSHQPGVAGLADTVYYLEDGRLIKKGSGAGL